ncbi:hypothetical protein [Legionella sp.]|uniref:hypothetical protein n=1 Tax=Legionella sp. TaxID=459 RepID=UPI000CCB7A32|nr:hypothetical protein [Legionella sp.]PJE18424.1 MAG: hypothetical protein CK430_00150 [Legionella sp.]
MKIGELKRILTELRGRVASNTTSPELLALFKKLESLVSELNDNDKVTVQLRAPLVFILDEFWAWVVKNLPHEKWQAGIEVDPWIELQRRLSKIPDKTTLSEVEDLQNELLEDELLLDKLRFQLEKSESENLQQGERKLAKLPSETDLDMQNEPEVRLSKIRALQQQIKRVEEGQKQKSLEIGKLIKRTFLVANYHHPRLFAALEEEYETAELSVRISF